MKPKITHYQFHKAAYEIPCKDWITFDRSVIEQYKSSKDWTNVTCKKCLKYKNLYIKREEQSGG